MEDLTEGLRDCEKTSRSSSTGVQGRHRTRTETNGLEAPKHLLRRRARPPALALTAFMRSFSQPRSAAATNYSTGATLRSAMTPMAATWTKRMNPCIHSETVA
jgi:hypothetical protein